MWSPNLKRYANSASMASVSSRLGPSYARAYGPFPPLLLWLLVCLLGKKIIHVQPKHLLGLYGWLNSMASSCMHDRYYMHIHIAYVLTWMYIYLMHTQAHLIYYACAFYDRTGLTVYSNFHPPPPLKKASYGPTENDDPTSQCHK